MINFATLMRQAAEDYAAGRDRQDTRPLLIALNYDFSCDEPRRGNRIALLRMAALFPQMFRLGAPDAPGLAVMGALTDPQAAGIATTEDRTTSLSGAGFTMQTAFEGCVGEGIEYLSQFLAGDEVLEVEPRINGLSRRDCEEIDAWLLHTNRMAGPWAPCKRIGGGEPAWLPALLIYRDGRRSEDEEAALSLGSGCAAGPALERATLKALLETIERDAVALWWCGGCKAAPFSSQMHDWIGTETIIAALRQQAENRLVRLLDITPDHGVPVVAALSFGRSGAEFAAGFSAHPDVRQAARAALIELCQMELGLHLIKAKRRALGETALNPIELQHEDRRHIGVDDIDMLCRDESRGGLSPQSFESDGDTLSAVAGRLDAHGFSAYVADLTQRRFGVPAVKVLVPGLQPYPASYSSNRLTEASRRKAGAAERSPHARGIGLF